MAPNSFKDIPGVDVLMNTQDIQPLIRDWGRLAVRETVRILQADLRRTIGAGESRTLDPSDLAHEINVRLVERGGRGPDRNVGTSAARRTQEPKRVSRPGGKLLGERDDAVLGE